MFFLKLKMYSVHPYRNHYIIDRGNVKLYNAVT